MPSFLHGVRVNEVQGGPRPVRDIQTAVIALVGTAPIWQVAAADQRVNDPTLVLSARDAAKHFGKDTAGYSIPAALDALQDHGAGTIIVVNVFDPAVHKAAVAADDFTFDAKDTITLPHQGVSSVVVKSADNLTTYVLDTDYTLDAVAGKVVRKAGGAIAAGATVNVNYDRPDVAAVTTAQVIGTTDANGVRSGLQAFRDSFSRFGYEPGVVIAPAYSTQASVATEMDNLAAELAAIALVDAPIGTTFSQALANRGTVGSNFNTSSERVVLLYPHLQRLDPTTGTDVLEPFSGRFAGVIAETDRSLGFWYSPSNKRIRGVTGVERILTASLEDKDGSKEVTQLNAAGIVTVFNAFGTGLRTWGNHTAAYPADTGTETFLAVRRTRDIVHKAIRLAMLPFIDLPLNEALIDAVAETVNNYFRSKIAQGALLGGSCTYNPALSDIAAGLVVFDIALLPPPPAQGIQFQSSLDLNLLRSGGEQTA